MPLVFVPSLVAFQILLLFVHLAAYATIAAAFGIGSPALKVVFIVLAFSFIVASILVYYSKSRLVAWAYTAAAYWFGLIHFLFFGGVMFYFAADALYSANIYVTPALIGSVSFGVFFFIHLYGTWLAGRAEITKLSVSLPNLPEFWRGKKVVFVSDPHLGAVRGAPFAAKIVRKIQTLAPDAIFVGGDLYDGVRCDAAALVAPFRSLRAPEGIYFVTGNHEQYGDIKTFLEAIRGTGMRILTNEAVDLHGLHLIGVDYKMTHRKEDFERIFAGISFPKGQPSILLRHEPNHLEVAERAGVSLVLSGHTHHGQIFPLSFITRTMYRGFDYGLKRLGAMQVYTSSGVGTWGPPLRLLTKSEIVLIELH